MIGPLPKVGGQRSAVSGYTTFFSQSFNSSSMSIIPWSCLLSSLAGPGSSGCCCATVILVTWCPSPWSSAVISSVTCQLSAWSSELKFQVTCCLSTWSFSTWVFLVTCYPLAWSSVTWSWFKVENINNGNNKNVTMIQ